MHTGFYWQIIYWFSTPTLAVVATILLVRHLHKRFPLFFSYIVVACLDDIARLVTYHTTFKTYAYTYWISQLMNTVFALLAIYELSFRRLFPQFQRIKFYRFLFLAAAITIATFAILTALHSIQTAVLFKILHGLDFLRVTTLFFFVALMLFMGRRWERHEFGIAFGFAVDAAAFLAAFAIWTRPGYMRTLAATMPVVAYDMAAVIWLIYFLLPEKRIVVSTELIDPKVLEQADQWKKTIRESLNGKERY